jgi:hypothetical protein
MQTDDTLSTDQLPAGLRPPTFAVGQRVRVRLSGECPHWPGIHNGKTLDGWEGTVVWKRDPVQGHEYMVGKFNRGEPEFAFALLAAQELEPLSTASEDRADADDLEADR